MGAGVLNSGPRVYIAVILSTELFPSPEKYVLRKAFDKRKCRFILEKNGQLWNLGDDVPTYASEQSQVFRCGTEN